MTDGPDVPRVEDPDAESPLTGLDAPRPLPPDLSARLESALLGALAGGLPAPSDAESLDAPRPLPPSLQARLESALLAEAATPPTATAPASGAPPIPVSPTAAAPATGAAEVVPLKSRGRKVAAWWSAAAAVSALLLGMAGLTGTFSQDRSGKVEVADAPTTAADKSASVPPGAGSSVEDSQAEASSATEGLASGATTPGFAKPSGPLPATTGPARTRTSPPDSSGRTEPGQVTSEPARGSTEPAPGPTDRGPAPPFYDSTGSGDAAGPPAMMAGPSAGSGQSDSAASPESQKSATPAAPAPTGPTLRVGVVRGDRAQERGFDAYIDRLNRSGGVAGYRIELVDVRPNEPPADTIATVNLTTLPVAGPGGALPIWAKDRPLLETLTATESLLPGGGAVFSFASAPERQGRLAVDALFPDGASVPAGTRAVIYTPTTAGSPSSPNPLHDAVPDAMSAVLKKRGFTTDRITRIGYDPSASRPLDLTADAIFLSLDPAAAKAWVGDAKAAGYPPGIRIAGIYSLADEALLADLPEGARVVSPYIVPPGAEGQAIRSEAGGPSASSLHGWATAKSLAASIWRTGADTPAALQAALAGLAGWSSGLAPAYETRPGTRSRTPEGLVLRVQSRGFVPMPPPGRPEGDFRRDPYQP